VKIDGSAKSGKDLRPDPKKGKQMLEETPYLGYGEGREHQGLLDGGRRTAASKGDQRGKTETRDGQSRRPTEKGLGDHRAFTPRGRKSTEKGSVSPP